MTRVAFKPWRGKQYEGSPLFGKKLLVLGESHYEWDKTQPINGRTSLTAELIEEQLSGNYTKRFWTNIAVAFLNHRPTLAEKASFWHSVAFYNYVQFKVGDRPRVRPAPWMWRDSQSAFFEVLNDLKPDLVVSLGYELWRNLPDLDRSPGPSIRGADQPNTWRYSRHGGATLAYGIRHPSAGFSGQYWHPYLLRAIAFS